MNYRYAFAYSEGGLESWAEHFTAKGIPFEVKKLPVRGWGLFINYRDRTREELEDEGWNIVGEEE